MVRKNTSRDSLNSAGSELMAMPSAKLSKVVLESDSEPVFQHLLRRISEDHLAFLSSAKQAVIRGIGCGRKLRVVRELVGHGAWEQEFETNLGKTLGFSLRSAQRYMALAKDFDGFLKTEAGASENLEELDFAEIDGSFLDSFKTHRTGKLVASQLDPNGWRTPESIRTSVLRYFPVIDCDPCAAPEQRESDAISCTYTIREDGLAVGSGWVGNAWVAPGHKGSFDAWVEKAFAELDSSAIDEALLMLPFSTVESSPRLLTVPFALFSRRIPVIRMSDGLSKSMHLNTAMAVFLLNHSPETERFAEAFRDIAVVYSRVGSSAK